MKMLLIPHDVSSIGACSPRIFFINGFLCFLEDEWQWNEENPEPEKPLLLPGWGQWTHVQQKKGLPSWMLKKHEDAQKKRAEALKKRKDAQLKNVIISEKIDKKVSAIKYKVLNLWYSFQIIDINLIQCAQLSLFSYKKFVELFWVSIFLNIGVCTLHILLPDYDL